jgi:hypothetical protein
MRKTTELWKGLDVDAIVVYKNRLTLSKESHNMGIAMTERRLVLLVHGTVKRLDS